MTDTYSHHLDRTIVIRARPETVFSFFTDDGRWASWWGAGSTIDPRPGGAVRIRYPNGVEASGAIVEIHPPERIVFTFGYASGAPVPPGASRVTIRLAPHDEGTRLSLTHEFADAASRDAHVQGWRYQLALFAGVATTVAHRDVHATIDRWFDAWAEPDAHVRAATLAAIASPSIRFRDRFGHTNGLDDLLPHLEGALRFMPGVRSARQGDAKVCQGTVLAAWTAQSPSGGRVGGGTNVFVLDADGRIESVTGFWD